jgi:hypothetical protein
MYDSQRKMGSSRCSSTRSLSEFSHREFPLLETWSFEIHGCRNLQPKGLVARKEQCLAGLAANDMPEAGIARPPRRSKLSALQPIARNPQTAVQARTWHAGRQVQKRHAGDSLRHKIYKCPNNNRSAPAHKQAGGRRKRRA